MHLSYIYRFGHIYVYKEKYTHVYLLFKQCLKSQETISLNKLFSWSPSSQGAMTNQPPDTLKSLQSLCPLDSFTSFLPIK